MRKQPYYIRLKTNEPMFFAATGQFSRAGNKKLGDTTNGFAIITSASDQGMVDIHDRMPVVLPPDTVNQWLTQGMTPERAENLARHHAEPVESFEWYEVGKDVGRVVNKGLGLIKNLENS